jgi:peptidyl-prolyl cis-trans isomerase SurA
MAAAIIFLISSADAQLVTTIDGQPITEKDIQQRSRLQELGTRNAPDRQHIIDELSNEIEEIEQARRHGVGPSEAEVNRSFEGIAMRMGVDSQKLTDILTKAGASVASLKQRLRGEMARANLEHGGFGLHGGGK